MVWLIILGFICLLILAICLANQVEYPRDWKQAILFIPIVLCVWLLALFAYNRSLNYETNKCAKWSITTGYESKYINIGYGDWACYGKTSDKWLPIENIRGIED